MTKHNSNRLCDKIVRMEQFDRLDPTRGRCLKCCISTTEELEDLGQLDHSIDSVLVFNECRKDVFDHRGVGLYPSRGSAPENEEEIHVRNLVEERVPAIEGIFLFLPELSH